MTAKLTEAISSAAQDPEIVKLYEENLGQQVRNLNGAELRAYLENAEGGYSDLIQSYDDGSDS